MLLHFGAAAAGRARVTAGLARFTGFHSFFFFSPSLFFSLSSVFFSFSSSLFFSFFSSLFFSFFSSLRRSCSIVSVCDCFSSSSNGTAFVAGITLHVFFGSASCASSAIPMRFTYPVVATGARRGAVGSTALPMRVR